MGTLLDLEAKYAFSPPELYARLVAARATDIDAGEAYLWLPEAEWMTIDDIIAYKPADYHCTGFVPFAFTGGGDYWCWWPAQDAEAVVLCPRDCQEGEFESASLRDFIYRRCLDYAFGGFDAREQAEARSYLSGWAQTLATYLPSSWCSKLMALSEAPLVEWSRGNSAGLGFCSPDEHDSIVEGLAFARLGERFPWMRS